jgi:uncharacterized surface protein with fasciclin (FAS1) repeats
MKLRKRLLGAIAIGAVALTAVPATQSSAVTPTLWQVLNSDGNRFDTNANDFDLVTEAVRLFPDLRAAANNPAAELTVFLPNDRAFRLLLDELNGDAPVPAREAKVLEQLAAAATAPVVLQVLQYHIVPAKAGVTDVIGLLGQDVKTLLEVEGETVTISPYLNTVPFFIGVKDMDKSDRNARVIAVNIGGEASNGFAHGIDRVLRPIDLP